MRAFIEAFLLGWSVDAMLNDTSGEDALAWTHVQNDLDLGKATTIVVAKLSGNDPRAVSSVARRWAQTVKITEPTRL
jgi:hypothetical protein